MSDVSIAPMCMHIAVTVYVLHVTPLANPRYLPLNTDPCLIIDSWAICYLENSHYCKGIRSKKGRGNCFPETVVQVADSET
jgi:hypothetical protein